MELELRMTAMEVGMIFDFMLKLGDARETMHMSTHVVPEPLESRTFTA